MIFFLFRPVVLELELASESHEECIKTQIPGPHFLSLQFSGSEVGPETRSQLLLPWGPSFENHYSRLLLSYILHTALWVSSFIYFQNFI